MATVNEKMTALADEVRELSGTTEAIGIDGMTSNINEANNEVESQAELLARAVSALSGKAGGESNAVLYTPQELTEEQKAQARENIGVVSGGSAGSGGAQPDWNANEGDPGHVLNRTHWSEQPYEPIEWHSSQKETADCIDLTAFGMGKMYKISNKLLTREQLGGSNCGGSTITIGFDLSLGYVEPNDIVSAEFGVEAYSWVVFIGSGSTDDYTHGILYLFHDAGEFTIPGTEYSIIIPSAGIYAANIEQLRTFIISKEIVHKIPEKYYRTYARSRIMDFSGTELGKELRIESGGTEEMISISKAYMEWSSAGTTFILECYIDGLSMSVPITMNREGAGMGECVDHNNDTIFVYRVFVRIIDTLLYARAYKVPATLTIYNGEVEEV